LNSNPSTNDVKLIACIETEFGEVASKDGVGISEPGVEVGTVGVDDDTPS